MTYDVAPAQLTLSGLANLIDMHMREHPETANMRVVFSQDDEGNGYSFVNPDLLFSQGVAESVYGTEAGHLEGVPAVCIWPGYPKFESLAQPEDDDG